MRFSGVSHSSKRGNFKKEGVEMKFSNSLSVLLVLITGLFLSACIDLKTKYSVPHPVDGASYVGTADSPPNVNDGTTETLLSKFTVAYTSPPGGDLEIVLNGVNISRFFQFGLEEATADVSDFKHLFRQGKNTLSVDLLSFGPVVTFYMDTKGPDIIIKKGNIINSGADVEIEGVLRDASGFGSILELELSQVKGYDGAGRVDRDPVRTVNIPVNPDGSFSQTVDIDGLMVRAVWEHGPGWDDNKAVPDVLVTPGISLLYSLHAVDEYGYTSSVEYLSNRDGNPNAEGIDSMPVVNSVRVAVGETFVRSMRPVIAAALKTALDDKPIDMGSNCKFGRDPALTQEQLDKGLTPCDISAMPNKTYVDIGMGNMPTKMNRVYLSDGVTAVDGLLLKRGTVLLNDFRIKEANTLGLDLVITNMFVDMTIDMPGWIAWIIPNIDMAMGIEEILVDSDVEVQAANKKVKAQMYNSRFALSGMKVTKTKAGGLNLTGLVGALLPVMEGMIGGMLPSIINPILEDNLQKIVIASSVYRKDLLPDTIAGAPNYNKDKLPKPSSTVPEHVTILDAIKDVPHMDMTIDIAELYTDTLLANVYDLMLGMDTTADLQTLDTYVKPVMGTKFSDDPINPGDVFNAIGGSNITVAVNSNMINQMLAANYSLGAMHLTRYKGKTYNGANPNVPYYVETPNVTYAAKDDTRMRLWIDTPPVFTLSNVVGDFGKSKASVSYPSASLSMDTFNGTEWVLDVELQVNFDIALLIGEVEGGASFEIAGAPVFKVNKFINNTEVQFPSSWVQNMVDAALLFAGDTLSDKVLTLPLASMADSFLNGERLAYYSSADNYTMTEEQCVEEADDGNYICTVDNCDSTRVAYSGGGGDNKKDVICHVIDFDMSTEAVGTIGDAGSHLFFQMTVKDADLPDPPRIPEFDLDEDGVIDYLDNCAFSGADLIRAIGVVNFNLGREDAAGEPIAGQTHVLLDPYYMDQKTGKPLNDFEALVRAAANGIEPERHGELAGTPISSEDQDWFNYLRKNDNDITVLNTTNWVKMRYSNRNQYNFDGDRVGEMCEDDRDRDGMYTDNIPASVDRDNPDELKYWIDNCPNIQQLREDGSYYTVGDAAYFLETETDSRTTAGDACDVRKNFVLIRSLGGKVLAGEDACLAHNFTQGENLGFRDGNTNPPILASIDGYPVFANMGSYIEDPSTINGLGRVGGVMACNPADPRQQWYIHPDNEASPTGYAIYSHPYVNHSYRRDVADEPNHPQRHVKIAAYEEGYGGVGAMTLINSDIAQSNNGQLAINTPDTGRRWSYSNFNFVPASRSNLGSTLEHARHPWYIDMKALADPAKVQCMMYGNFLGDFDPGLCRVAYDHPHSTIDVTKEDDWRWGILIGPEMEPWNSEWCITDKCNL